MKAPGGFGHRGGRCGAGREAAGKAFRLYTEAAFLGLQAASAPEIQRVSLASLVLQLKQLGVADMTAFPFMDAPPKAALLRALELLLALGALDADGALSKPLGAQLVRLPLEPAFGKVCARMALPLHPWDIIIILLLHAFPANRQGTSCRQAELHDAIILLLDGLAQIQARPNQPWARCSEFRVCSFTR